ncbi:YugN-like family protein [Bacillus xiapuensis]|uniref:YugN-like family protein n=1 Tax=Bacillus xiapuensis TaxID=2014075 RepID=UPI000C23807F|nr:YugN-like family protein [Bacillus xiapuensis]
MIELSSTLPGKSYTLYELEQKLKPMGYVIGGNWDYDHGSFDYKIDDQGGYQFLRLPFVAADGQLDSPGVTVRFGQPYVLSHVYQQGLDEEASAGNFSGSFNQFAEPEDPDGRLKEKYIISAKRLLEEAEKMLNA